MRVGSLSRNSAMRSRRRRKICFSLSVILDIFNRGSSVFIFSCGVSPPHDEVPSTGSGQALLFRQKDPKPLAPGRGPSGTFAPVPISRAAELASLRQSSPPKKCRDWGAATPAGTTRHVKNNDRWSLRLPTMIVDQADSLGENARLHACLTDPIGQDGPDFSRFSKMLNHLRHCGHFIVAL